MKVIVAGGGLVGGTLARRLVDDGHTVTVIDRSPAVCATLHEKVGATAIVGEATDPAVLADAGIARADVAAAMLPRDADNLAFSLLVGTLSTARVIARLMDPACEKAYRLAGVRDAIGETDLVVDRTLAAIEFPRLGRTLPLSGEVLLFEVPIGSKARLANRTVAEVRSSEGFPADCVFIAIVAPDGQTELPTGSTVLAPGRTALVVARRDLVGRVLECMTATPSTLDPRLTPVIAALRRIAFLAPLDDDELAHLASGVTPRRLVKGEVLFRQDDPGTEFYVVLSGEIGLEGDDGSRSVVEAGGYFGELSLLTGEARTRTATARAPTELGVVRQEEFSEIVGAHPSIALEMSRVLGRRLLGEERGRKKGFLRRLL